MSVHMSVHMFVHMSVHTSVHTSVRMSAHMSPRTSHAHALFLCSPYICLCMPALQVRIHDLYSYGQCSFGAYTDVCTDMGINMCTDMPRPI